MPQPEISLLLYITVTGGVSDINRFLFWLSPVKGNFLIPWCSHCRSLWSNMNISWIQSILLQPLFLFFQCFLLIFCQVSSIFNSSFVILMFLACLVRRLKFVLSCSSSSFIFYLIPGFLLKFSFALSLCSKSFQFYFIS